MKTSKVCIGLTLVSLLSVCCGVSRAAKAAALVPEPPGRVKVSWTFFGEAPFVGKLGCSVTHLNQGWAWIHHQEHFNTIVDQVNGFGDIVYGFGLVIHFR